MKKVAIWAALILVVWPTQYLVFVPVVWFARAIAFGLTVGGWGILLIFLPVVGWIILGFMMMSRGANRRNRELIAAIERANREGEPPPVAPVSSLYRPWFLHLVQE